MKPRQIVMEAKRKTTIYDFEGKARLAEDWEVFWHELTHAERDDKGERKEDENQEETETIEKMNTLRDWYNKNNPEDEPDLSKRDPKTHSKPPEEKKETKGPKEGKDGC